MGLCNRISIRNRTISRNNLQIRESFQPTLKRTSFRLTKTRRDSFLKNVKVCNTNFRWEMNVGWHKPSCLLSFICTDCSSKIEDMRSVAEKRCNHKIFNVLSPHFCRNCENQAKVGSVVSSSTHFILAFPFEESPPNQTKPVYHRPEQVQLL